MKKLLAFVLVLGCSSEPTTDTGTYPGDAGTDTESTPDMPVDCASDAGPNEPSPGMPGQAPCACTPIVWSYGPDRFCEQCVCPGTECRTHALGEELITGVCGEDLKCSAKCSDPLWIEMFGQ